MMVAETGDRPRTGPLIRLAGLVALIAAVAIVGHASGVTAVRTHEVREWVQGFSRLAPLVFICLFAALNTLGLPAPVLGAVGGATFGLFEGATVTLSAMWVTACIQFLLARRLGGERLNTPSRFPFVVDVWSRDRPRQPDDRFL